MSSETNHESGWRRWIKREGNRLGSLCFKWWIALGMLGVVEASVGIVRHFEYPWGWGEYLIVAALATWLAITEWVALLAVPCCRWLVRKLASQAE